MESRPAFVRSTSNPGSPGLLLHERMTAAERNTLIKGQEEIVAKAMEEFGQCTFHNYLQYLLVLLGMPADIQEYENIEDFQEKVKLILKNWSILFGDQATLGLLTEKLRNHRSISEKIYVALKAHLKLPDQDATTIVPDLAQKQAMHA